VDGAALASGANLDLEGPPVEPPYGATDRLGTLAPVEDGVHENASVDEEGSGGFHAPLVRRPHRHRGRLPAQAVELKQIRKEDLLEVTSQRHGSGTFPDAARALPRPASGGHSTVRRTSGKFPPTGV
jgi:hypothetical protein